MSNGSGNGGKLRENKTVRAAGRIGIGTGAAMVFAYFVAVPEGLREAVAGFIILIVNEIAYVGGLVWKHFVEKIENWSSTE